MALKDLLNINNQLVNGVLGNMSEVSVTQLEKEYGGYLMDDEKIILGFKLVRDVIIFTDKRIIDFDKQGTTGSKTRVISIFLDSIYSVTAETAGFGLDDSEITISFITSPNMRSNNISLESKKYEFPKKYEIQPLYKMLHELAYNNYKSLNNLR
jgi:hypothetical protein